MEKENKQEKQNAPIERAVETENEDPATSTYFYVFLVIIILAFASIAVYKYATSSQNRPLTIEDLHELNLKGKLPPEKGYITNGFSFVLFDRLWYTKIEAGDNLYQIPLHFGPNDVKNVVINGNGVDKEFNNGTDVYLVVNPLSPDSKYIALATSELAQNMITAIKRRPVGACDRNETSMCIDRPIITDCEKSGKPVVYLIQENGPAIDFKGNCVILRGVQSDLVKAVDRLLMKWYNIL